MSWSEMVAMLTATGAMLGGVSMAWWCSVLTVDRWQKRRQDSTLHDR